MGMNGCLLQERPLPPCISCIMRCLCFSSAIERFENIFFAYFGRLARSESSGRGFFTFSLLAGLLSGKPVGIGCHALDSANYDNR